MLIWAQWQGTAAAAYFAYKLIYLRNCLTGARKKIWDLLKERKENLHIETNDVEAEKKKELWKSWKKASSYPQKSRIFNFSFKSSTFYYVFVPTAKHNK
jgi:hypothetical protein